MRKFGDNIKGTAQETEDIARVATDAFAIIIACSYEDDYVEFAQRIPKCLNGSLEVDGNNIDVSAHIGAAIYPDHSDSSKLLLQRADVAMFNAKSHNKGFTLYNTNSDPTTAHRLSMMGELRRGINLGEFQLYYQPKINLNQVKVAGVEALIRWIHSKHCFMPPDDFIPLAEQTGHIGALSYWVIDQSINRCADWQEGGLDLFTAINLSVRDLLDPSLPGYIDSIINARSVNRSKVIMEITESAVMCDPERSLETLVLLKDMGLTLSIDDYGTGNSLMSYLKRLLVGELKIDKSFVLTLAENRDDEIIVRSTIDLGHNMGLKMIAEGEDDEKSLQKLRDYGCDMGQGFYFTKPLPIDQFKNWLKESEWGLGS